MVRACETCHARKVKCDLSASGTPQARCSNCIDAGIECRQHIRKRRHAQVSQTMFDSPGAAVVNKRQAQRRETTSANTTIGNPQLLSLNSVDSPPTPRPSFLGRSDYIASSDLAIDEDDAMRYQAPDTHNRSSIAAIQATFLQSASAVGIPPQSLRESLVKSFLEKGKPWMPVVTPSDLDLSQSTNNPSLVLTSTLVAGSRLSASPHALEWGEKCYLYAKVVFFHGSVPSTLELIKSTILVQWWNPSGPEHVSLDSSSFWLRIGVGLSHQIGLHREPDPRLPDARLRRRLWWTLVSRDNQISTSHGRPRALSLKESNVRPISCHDFEEPEHLDTQLFIHFVHINSILGDIAYHHRCGNLSLQRRLEIERRLIDWVHELPIAFHLYNRNSWHLEPYSFKSRQIHVQFFIGLIILYRSESPRRKIALISLRAASMVVRIFEEFIDWGDIMFLAPPCIFYLLVAGLTQMCSHLLPELAHNVEAEIRTVRLGLRELKKRFATAYGAERIFENLLRRTSAVSDTTMKGPVPLSPFQEDILRHFGPKVCAPWPAHLDERLADRVHPTRDPEPRPIGERGTQMELNSLDSIGRRNSPDTSNFHVRDGQHYGIMDPERVPPFLSAGFGEDTFGGLDSWFAEWTEDTEI